MIAYYNEIDPFAAAWLRELIKAGHIAPGDVDERDIRDIKPEDLRGYTQCHFFAGIGTWSHALCGAGWSDDALVWTGSCPCQPFSAAGKRGGTEDERHLWPDFFRLIAECRPPVVFGEQVASNDGLQWLDIVSVDLEGAGYAFGAADLCAAGIGAPHIRQRLYWVADAVPAGRAEGRSEPRLGPPARSGEFGGMGHTEPIRQLGRRIADDGGSNGHARDATERDAHRDGASASSATSGFWGNAEWLPCRDGKARPVEPGTFPLAHGAPARVGRLRGYGNGIVAPLAQTFIEAYLET